MRPTRALQTVLFRSTNHTTNQQPPMICCYDLVVVGGGVVGLAVCRAAALQGHTVACLEREHCLLAWASGGNSGIVCTGVDAAEGTLERALIRDSVAQLRRFAREMNLPLRPCGSLVCQWRKRRSAAEEDEVDADGAENDTSTSLQKVLMESHDAGDTHATLLSPEQVRVMEPHLHHHGAEDDSTGGLVGAVHIPGETVVDPWLHAIAYAVHARQNGAVLYTNYELDASASSYDRQRGIWTLRRRKTTTRDGDRVASAATNDDDDTNSTPDEIQAHAVVNATGLWADLVQRDMLKVDAALLL